MNANWRANLIEEPKDVLHLLATSHRLAVVGIKPQYRDPKPAFTVPRYLQEQGYRIIPVPVYYPEVTEILGEPIYRSVAGVPPPVDLVVVFRRAPDIPAHVPDLIAARPRGVWFQLGIRNDQAARALAEAGIKVVQDRCTAIEHRQLQMMHNSRANADAD